MDVFTFLFRYSSPHKFSHLFERFSNNNNTAYTLLRDIFLKLHIIYYFYYLYLLLFTNFIIVIIKIFYIYSYGTYKIENLKIDYL